jgi:hypothetical protein
MQRARGEAHNRRLACTVWPDQSGAASFLQIEGRGPNHVEATIPEADIVKP